MDRGNTISLNLHPVHARRIALVDLEAVTGLKFGIGDHPEIPLGLGQDGCGHYGMVLLIPPHYSPSRQRAVRNEQTVDQNEIRNRIDVHQGSAHSQECRPVDIQPVDLLRPGPTEGPGIGLIFDQFRGPAALLRCEHLRICKHGEQAIRSPIGQHDRGSSHGPGDGSPSRLIDSTYPHATMIPVRENACTEEDDRQAVWEVISTSRLSAGSIGSKCPDGQFDPIGNVSESNHWDKLENLKVNFKNSGFSNGTGTYFKIALVGHTVLSNLTNSLLECYNVFNITLSGWEGRCIYEL